MASFDVGNTELARKAAAEAAQLGAGAPLRKKFVGYGESTGAAGEAAAAAAGQGSGAAPQAASASHASGAAPAGKRGASVALAKRLEQEERQKQAAARARPLTAEEKRAKELYERWFTLPPNFVKGCERNKEFLGRALNPTVLLEPLPTPLRMSLTRSVGSFTKIFTQFFDGSAQQGARSSLGIN